MERNYVTFTFNVTRELRRLIRIASADRDITVGVYVRRAVERALEEDGYKSSP